MSSLSCGGCSNSLKNGDVYYEDGTGGATCGACHDKNQKKCAKCNCGISVKVYKTFEGKCYHTDCYRCASCNGTFGKKSPNVDSDGKMYCDDCNKVCKTCNKQIRAGKSMQLGDDAYHPECYVCSECKGKLGSGEVFLTAEKDVVCDKCAKQ